VGDGGFEKMPGLRRGRFQKWQVVREADGFRSGGIPGLDDFRQGQFQKRHTFHIDGGLMKMRDFMIGGFKSRGFRKWPVSGLAISEVAVAKSGGVRSAIRKSGGFKSTT
jgi:hypothetical protein